MAKKTEEVKEPEILPDYEVELPAHQPTVTGFYESETKTEIPCLYTIRDNIVRYLLQFYQKQDNISGTEKDMDELLSDAKKIEQYILGDLFNKKYPYGK